VAVVDFDGGTVCSLARFGRFGRRGVKQGLGEMTGQRPEKHLRMAARVATLAAVAFLTATAAADAQQRYLGSTSNVVIDLGALDNGSLGGDGQLVPGSGGSVVLFPPAQAPVSRLLGPLAGRSITLTPPAAASPASPAPQQPAAQAPAPAAPAAPATVTAAITPPSAPPAPATPAPAPPAPAETATSAPATPAPPSKTASAPPPAPAAESAPAPTPATPAPPVQTAARNDAPPPEGETRIVFDAGSANLTDAAKAQLDALASELKANEAWRIELQAYAAGTDETAPDARRLSLSRALKVRSHLIDQGVRSTRMDVRALGIRSEDGPGDRVDAVIVQR
jgi:outer membrane protein OmpA-like peptidoglycan-associated protein